MTNKKEIKDKYGTITTALKTKADVIWPLPTTKARVGSGGSEGSAASVVFSMTKSNSICKM